MPPNRGLTANLCGRHSVCDEVPDAAVEFGDGLGEAPQGGLAGRFNWHPVTLTVTHRPTDAALGLRSSVGWFDSSTVYGWYLPRPTAAAPGLRSLV